MSDHWNSLANLLGTPSLAPPKAKGEPIAPPPAEPSPPTTASGNIPKPVETQVEEKQRPPEKSRLKSSWDAVAGFFGIAPPEPPPPAASNSSSDVAPAKRAEPPSKSGPSKKGRPSMWSDPSAEQPVEKTAPRAPTQDDRAERDGIPRARHESKRTRDSAARVEPVAQEKEPVAPKNEPAARQKEKEGELVDRRSHRRPPRRTRSEDARTQDAGTPSSSEQPPTPRPRREPNQGERSRERPTSRSPQESRTREPRSQDSRALKRTSTFGEGIDSTTEQDRDSISDSSEIDTIDFGYEAIDENSTTDAKEGRSRRRRRGGRGRNRDQSEENGSARRADVGAEDPSSDQPDGDEEAAPSVRHSKIPTWTETIRVLVEANMQNHQRSQGSHRGNSRGRGRR